MFVLRSPCPLSRAHRLRLSPTARSFGSLSSQSPPPHILSAGYSVVFEKTSPHSSKGNDWPCDIKLTQQRKAKGKFILLPCIPQFTWFCHSPDIAKAEPIILLTFHGTSTPNWHSRVIRAEEEKNYPLTFQAEPTPDWHSSVIGRGGENTSSHLYRNGNSFLT